MVAEPTISCHGVMQTKNRAPSTIRTSSNLFDSLFFPLGSEGDDEARGEWSERSEQREQDLWGNGENPKP